MTASTLEEDRISLEKICQGFLYKPIIRYQLTAEIKKIFPSIPSSVSALEIMPQKTVKLPLNPEILNKLSELKLHLEEEEKNQWFQIKKTMIRGEIRQFIQRLKPWGEEYQYPPLLDYITILEQQFHSFDIENITQTIEDFPKIRKAIEDDLLC